MRKMYVFTRTAYVVLSLLIVSCIAVAANADDQLTVRVAVLKIGTVNWELETIKANGLDEKHGFRLEVKPYADNNATRLAVEGDQADIAVSDWIWLARQMVAGKDHRFIPYSKAVGGVVVPQDSPAKTLADLSGGKIGIAGGPLDKSWLILQAYAQAEYGMDLKAQTEQVFGAPPLIFKSGLNEGYSGTVNYWHFLSKMKAAGMRELVSVQEAVTTLGLDENLPLLGYYAKSSTVQKHPEMLTAFYAASRDAKQVLQSSDEAWQAIKPLVNAENNAQFEQLRADWLAGIPAPGPVNEREAQKLLTLMAELGGTALVGGATQVPTGLFATVE